jgi:hypothetical protein
MQGMGNANEVLFGGREWQRSPGRRMSQWDEKTNIKIYIKIR